MVCCLDWGDEGVDVPAFPWPQAALRRRGDGGTEAPHGAMDDAAVDDAAVEAATVEVAAVEAAVVEAATVEAAAVDAAAAVVAATAEVLAVFAATRERGSSFPRLPCPVSAGTP